MPDPKMFKSVRLPVDVGDRTASALVLRDGLQLKAPILESLKVREYVDKLFPTNRFKIPRVLHQGISPGVKVARGTVVDITLVPASDIKVGLFETSHLALREKTVADVAVKITDDIAKVLSDHQSGATLSTEEKAKITGVLNGLSVTPNDGAADTSFETAFQTLRDVQVFR